MVRDLGPPYILKRKQKTWYCFFLNGRLQRYSLGVYSVESYRVESVYDISNIRGKKHVL